MLEMGKLLGMFVANRAISNANISIINRTFSHVMAFLALIVLSSIMLGAVMVFALYAGYMSLIYYGYATLDAVVIVFCLGLAIAVLCMAGAVACLRQLKEIAHVKKAPESPRSIIASRLHNILDEFVCGFMEAPPNRAGKGAQQTGAANLEEHYPYPYH